MIELSPAEFPVDRVMGALEYDARFDTVCRWNGQNPNLPVEEIAELNHQLRDQSLDEAEETLREESEYWHGMSEVGDEWFFTLED